MKKSFIAYLVSWLALLGLFNVIAFVSVGWINQEKYTDSFWIGYVFITIMFVAQLACAYAAFRADSAKKLFYNISLIRSSYAGLIASFIFGGLCMLISPLPYWVGIILCAIVLVCNVLSVAKATVVIGEVAAIDKKIKSKTLFIKMITADAQTLVAKASGEELAAEAKKVYEAIRYSDPMSDDALCSVEDKISDKFGAFSSAVEAGDLSAAQSLSGELAALITERNNKCRLLK